MTVTCEEVVTVFRGPRVILMGLLPGKVIATPIAVAQRIGNGFDNRWVSYSMILDACMSERAQHVARRYRATTC